MAKQGGRVRLEQSGMHHTLNTAKMATGGFQRMAIEESHHLNKKPHTEVLDVWKLSVESPRHSNVKSATD